MLNVNRELARLEKLPVADLRARYTELCGNATTSRNRKWLIRRILWRMQANEYGGLSERAIERARELAGGADLRVTAPRVRSTEAAGQTVTRAVRPKQRLPLPGSILRRRYKGREIRVRVLASGFEFEGERFKTLSAVAKHVTGAHWNGYRFFKLDRSGGDNQ